MSSKRLLRTWFGAAFLLWASFGAAAPLRVTGTVRGGAGAQAELLPAYESYADALRRLTDKQAPAPLAKARVGAGGTYELLAPEKGCFRVVVRAEGFLPVEIPFLPLVDHQELPTAPRVRAGLARTEGDERPSPPWSLAEAPPAMAGRRFRIEVRNAADQPVPQALVRRRGVPVAVTGQDGRLEIALPEEGPPLTVESRAGEQARIAVPAKVSGDGSETVPIRLAPPRRVSGQVVDAQTRKPAPGALVWNGRPLTAAPVLAAKDGTFEISLPSWAAETLEGTAPAYEPGETRIAGKTPPERVVLPLSPTGLLFGVVIDSAERPVPGTLAVAHPPRIRDGVPEPISARGSEDGRFVLRGLLPNGTYWLTLTRQGFSRRTVQVRTHPTGQTPLFRFVLYEGPVVKGRLVDEGGRSVAGAEVVLRLYPADESFEEKAEWPAVSDAAGMFNFGRVSAGVFSLEAAHPDYAELSLPEVEIPGDGPDVDLGTLTLAAGGELEGKVLSAGGKPIEGAEVRIESSIRHPLPPRPLATARTGPDGVFRARGLRRGETFYVSAWRQGYAPEELVQVRVPPEAPVRIELKPVRGLSGQVVGSEGEPVAGAVVSYYHSWREYFGDVRDVADSQGRFRLAGLSPGETYLEVSAEGYVKQLVRDLRVPEGRDLEGVKIVLERVAHVVEARVLEAGGEPVANAVVYARCGSDPVTRTHSTCDTDLQGRCRVEGSAALPCEIAAERRLPSSMSSSEARASKVTVPPGTGASQIELRFPPSVEVSGRILGEDGRGIPGLQFLMTDLGRESGSWLQTEADGSFRVTRVPDGTYRLAASRNNASDQVEITVWGQPVQGVELRLGGEEPEVTLSGRLLGVPPADLPRISVVALNKDAYIHGRVEPEGTYRIQGLLPGQWTLEIGTPGGLVLPKLIIPPGSTEITRDLEIPPYRFVSGRVLLNGEPLARAEVEISNGSQKWLALTGPEGTFRLGFLDPSETGDGLYRIKAWKEGIAPFETSIVVPQNGEAQPVEIPLSGGP